MGEITEDSPVLTLQNQYVQYPYRYLIATIFILLSTINGMIWTVITPIAIPIASAYHQSTSAVALIPTSFMMLYAFINFPSSWIIDIKGIRKALLIGIILTCLGAAIRILINIDFAFMIIGQLFCAAGQPFILNATTKVAVRWFLPQSRSVAIAIFMGSNVIGNAVGAVLPSIFMPDLTSTTAIRSQFVGLLIFQFILGVITLVMTVCWFEQSPPTPATPAEQYEQHHFWEQIKSLFKKGNFISLLFAFSCVVSVYAMYGSISDNILSNYGYSSSQVSYFIFGQYLCGVVSATLFGFYIENTLNYRMVFRVMAVIAVVVSVGVPLLLVTVGKSFGWMMVLFSAMGTIVISVFPLTFDYGCDVFYPAGQGQITGCLFTAGNLAGFFITLAATNLFGLGNTVNTPQQNKQAALNLTIFASFLMLVGMAFYVCFDNRLSRSQLEEKYHIGHHEDN